MKAWVGSDCMPFTRLLALCNTCTQVLLSTYSRDAQIFALNNITATWDEAGQIRTDISVQVSEHIWNQRVIFAVS